MSSVSKRKEGLFKEDGEEEEGEVPAEATKEFEEDEDETAKGDTEDKGAD